LTISRKIEKIVIRVLPYGRITFITTSRTNGTMYQDPLKRSQWYRLLYNNK